MAGNKLTFSAGFCLILAALLLIIPIQWLLAFITAAIVHEAGHYLAIRLLCGKRGAVSFYAWGAKMTLPEISRGKEVLCALAGPLFGLSLLLVAQWLPRVAVCAAMQSAYNLLPVYPLDGGRALQSGLAIALPPPKAAKICHWVTLICKTGIAVMALYGAIFLTLGIFPLILAAVLLIPRK